MREEVQDYYGKQLTGSDDLQTNACCDQAPPEHLKPLLARLHDEVVTRYYGCGLVAPAALEGMRILDLAVAPAGTSTCSRPWWATAARWSAWT